MENVLDPGSWYMNAVRRLICGQIHRNHEFFREVSPMVGAGMRLLIAIPFRWLQQGCRRLVMLP